MTITPDASPTAAPPLAPTGATGATALPAPRKPLRLRIGIALLVLYPFFYLVLPVAPFLPLDVAMKATVVAVVLGAAEILLLVAIALVGKDAYRAIKAKVLRRPAPDADRG